MSAIEQRIARLEKAANISTIDVAAILTARLAAMRSAMRSGDRPKPTREERLAHWRAMLEQPLEPKAAELVARIIRAHELAGEDDNAD
jgi:hypothetical protein